AGGWRRRRGAQGPREGSQGRDAQRPAPNRCALRREWRRSPRRRQLFVALQMGRRGPVWWPLAPSRRPQPLTDDLFRLEEEIDLDLRVVVTIGAVDRVGLDRFRIGLADRSLVGFRGIGRA